jgi:type I restriction enzyme S subunit
MNYEIVGIGEICDFVRGVTFDGNEVLSEKLDGYVPILRAGNISDTLEIQNDLVWVPSKRVSKEQYLQNYDIAICMASGSPAVLGKTAQVTQKFIGSVGAFCGIIRVKKADPSFIGYYFKSSAFMKWRDRQARGINIQNLRPTEVQEIQIPLPSLPEQQRIAAILQKANRLRHLRRYARQLSDGYLQSVFLEMFGDPATNPKGWEKGYIDDVISTSQYGTSTKSNNEQKGFPILGMANITYSGQLDLSSIANVELSEDEFNGLKLEKGDIIFNRTNSTELVGKTALWDADQEAVLASYLIKLKVNQKVTPDFLCALMNTHFYKRLFRDRCKKAIGQSNVSPTLLREFPVFIPPIDLQKEYSVKTSSSIRFFRIQVESERQTEMFFQSLMQRAFQGEL